MWKGFKEVFEPKGKGADTQSNAFANVLPNTRTASMFSFQKVLSHGWSGKATALAYDAVQSLVAVGLDNGTIWIYGKSDVELSFSVGDFPIEKIQFAVNKGFVVGYSGQTLFRVDLATSPPKVDREHKFEHKVTAMHIPVDTEWIYVGTMKGNIIPFNINRWLPTKDIIYWNLCSIQTEHKHPGSVLSISEQPADNTKLLLGHSEGSICLYDTQLKKAVGTWGIPEKEPLTSLCWHPREDKFVSGHSTGMSAIWTLKNPHPESVKRDASTRPASPEVISPVTHLAWAYAGSEPMLVNTGGDIQTPNLFTLSLSTGRTEKSLAFDHPVVDFAVLSPSPWQMDEKTPGGLAVLLDHQLLVCDIMGPGMPYIKSPYASRFLRKNVTCMVHVCNDVTPGVVTALRWLGRKKTHKDGTPAKVWPLTGGIPGGKSGLPSPELLILGYDDGTLAFLDVTNAALSPLCVLDIEEICESAIVPVPPNCTIANISFCPVSRVLCVACASGEVLLFTFATTAKDVTVTTCTPSLQRLLPSTPSSPAPSRESASGSISEPNRNSGNRLSSPAPEKRKSTTLGDIFGGSKKGKDEEEVKSGDLNPKTGEQGGAGDDKIRRKSGVFGILKGVVPGKKHHDHSPNVEKQPSSESKNDSGPEDQPESPATPEPQPDPTTNEIATALAEAANEPITTAPTDPATKSESSKEEKQETQPIEIEKNENVEEEGEKVESENSEVGGSKPENEGQETPNIPQILGKSESTTSLSNSDKIVASVNYMAQPGFQLALYCYGVRVRDETNLQPVTAMAINSEWKLLALCVDAGVVVIEYAEGLVTLEESFACRAGVDQSEKPTSLEFCLAFARDDDALPMPSVVVGTSTGTLLKYAVVPGTDPLLVDKLRMRDGSILGTIHLDSIGRPLHPPTDPWVEDDIEDHQAAVDMGPGPESPAPGNHTFVVVIFDQWIDVVNSPSNKIVGKVRIEGGKATAFNVFSIGVETCLSVLDEHQTVHIYSVPNIKLITTIPLCYTEADRIELTGTGRLLALLQNGTLDRCTLLAHDDWLNLPSALPSCNRDGLEIPPRPTRASVWSLFGANSETDRAELFTLPDGNSAIERLKAKNAERQTNKVEQTRQQTEGLASKMNENKQMLLERGEKLANIEDKTADMANNAKAFANRIKEYNRKQAAKKWYEF
eukprot:comp23689_c0_seq1/m.40668 comp23689_c0_seq1/g.40668  ORF comp23689_c0_seq1/g.40668 comp23689_c0_seq1/m.40668 type:complete len:1175 (-) comp23689_c0_seq1:573-4097(-)